MGLTRRERGGAAVPEKARVVALMGNPNVGKSTVFNALTGQYEDMIKAGIVDPAKVVRSALQNAASIAAMVLTTETLVADKPEKTPPMPPAGGMGGGMPGMM